MRTRLSMRARTEKGKIDYSERCLLMYATYSITTKTVKTYQDDANVDAVADLMEKNSQL